MENERERRDSERTADSLPCQTRCVLTVNSPYLKKTGLLSSHYNFFCSDQVTPLLDLRFYISNLHSDSHFYLFVIVWGSRIYIFMQIFIWQGCSNSLENVRICKWVIHLTCKLHQCGHCCGKCTALSWLRRLRYENMNFF